MSCAMMPDAPCVSYPDEKRKGRCVRCQKPILSIVTARDLTYEYHFLREIERATEKRFGIPGEGYALRVQHRLAIGAQRYGEDNFLRVDVIKELLEETPDVGAYAVLEAQKQLRGDVDDDIAWHLFECALGGAYADYHARMARAR